VLVLVVKVYGLLSLEQLWLSITPAFRLDIRRKKAFARVCWLLAALASCWFLQIRVPQFDSLASSLLTAISCGFCALLAVSPLAAPSLGWWGARQTSA
jgi:hypothetical protein